MFSFYFETLHHFFGNFCCVTSVYRKKFIEVLQFRLHDEREMF
jgi:hypothetical protein